MIELLMMSLGMLILGYSFYQTIAITTFNSHRIPLKWKGPIKIGAGILLLMFFMFGFVFFNLVSLLPAGLDFTKLVLSSVFLCGSVIAVIIVRVSSETLVGLSESSERFKNLYENEAKMKRNLEERLDNLNKELEVIKRNTDREREHPKKKKP